MLFLSKKSFWCLLAIAATALWILGGCAATDTTSGRGDDDDNASHGKMDAGTNTTDGSDAVGEGEGMPGEGEPAEGEGFPEEGEGIPAEGEGIPAEGEGSPAEGEGVLPESCVAYLNEVCGCAYVAPQACAAARDEVDGMAAEDREQYCLNRAQQFDCPTPGEGEGEGVPAEGEGVMEGEGVPAEGEGSMIPECAYDPNKKPPDLNDLPCKEYSACIEQCPNIDKPDDQLTPEERTALDQCAQNCQVSDIDQDCSDCMTGLQNCLQQNNCFDAQGTLDNDCMFQYCAEQYNACFPTTPPVPEKPCQLGESCQSIGYNLFACIPSTWDPADASTITGPQNGRDGKCDMQVLETSGQDPCTNDTLCLGYTGEQWGLCAGLCPSSMGPPPIVENGCMSGETCTAVEGGALCVPNGWTGGPAPAGTTPGRRNGACSTNGASTQCQDNTICVSSQGATEGICAGMCPAACVPQ